MTTAEPPLREPFEASLPEAEAFLEKLRHRTPGEAEYHQAAAEVVRSVMPLVLDRKDYRDAAVLERLTEPDRIVSFRVVWVDDAGAVRVNRAYRVQFSNTLGPYKGGLRFHPTVTRSVLKFLGFEQIFKNALTSLPLGGGKGGSDFDPKGKSDAEVMRFCQAMMTELARYIGPDRDVPAGDIGVGAREIGYLFGQHRRMTGDFTGTITGKGTGWGGSLVRTEATGYGLVYFVHSALEHRGESLEARKVAISGSGNVAIYAAEKATDLGARVVTMSDSGGTIHDPDGIDAEKLAFIKDLKEVRRGRLHAYAERFGCEFLAGATPWAVACDIALPCATQNEVREADADTLIANGVRLIGEGANMPLTQGAIDRLSAAGVPIAPGKAANAGGVSVSGLEMSQNAEHMAWEREEVDTRLREIMRRIHDQCVEHGASRGGVHYIRGANRAAFVRVADAMVAQGVL